MSKLRTGEWRVAEAKQSFSEVLRAAENEPQRILNRDRVVGAVIDAASLEAFEAWRRSEARPLAEAFAELRSISADEGYALKTGQRRNRANALTGILARAAR